MIMMGMPFSYWFVCADGGVDMQMFENDECSGTPLNTEAVDLDAFDSDVFGFDCDTTTSCNPSIITLDTCTTCENDMCVEDGLLSTEFAFVTNLCIPISDEFIAEFQEDNPDFTSRSTMFVCEDDIGLTMVGYDDVACTEVSVEQSIFDVYAAEAEWVEENEMDSNVVFDAGCSAECETGESGDFGCMYVDLECVHDTTVSTVMPIDVTDVI
eukprot:CAMPEP_0202685060 /NCGR_PEP_ID=MMETSP1385-20130828/716_1 /ASSEMBLY_ACC=CAM_ASM_000861 /TAXON_ID=933848 /ORGANISM="Elphidium margaritaceum" /LENGTH=211 /DNA_ID=CAMNT_0049339305 /DNA_START=173 /DNA_END=808 /DNA_ORIENTATION=+